MSDPITIEKCEVCQQPFNLAMQKYRRGGGWHTGDASFAVYYEGDEADDLSMDTVCPSCASAICNAARQEVNRLRP